MVQRPAEHLPARPGGPGGCPSILNEEQVFVPRQTALQSARQRSPASQSACPPFTDVPFLFSLFEQDVHVEINFHCAHTTFCRALVQPEGNGPMDWSAIKTTNAFNSLKQKQLCRGDVEKRALCSS